MDNDNKIEQRIWCHEEISKMLHRAWSSHYEFSDRCIAEGVGRLWSMTPLLPPFEETKVPYPNGDAYLVAAAPNLFWSLAYLLSKSDVVALLSDDEFSLLRNVLCSAEGNFNTKG